MTTSRVLVTGVSGQVGHELLYLLKGQYELYTPLRREMDLGDASSIRSYIRSVAPHWIVNAAAYTAVDKAESEKDLADAINAGAPGVLGEEALRLGATVVHYSTDYVFSGAGTSPWSETDEPNPLNVYGASKLAGEKSLAQSGAKHFIFRTSWVYGASGNNFFKTILRVARERKELRVVDDQFGAPTWSRNLAKLAQHVIQASSEQTLPQGLYHACDSGETSWYGFAEEILRLARKYEDRPYAALTPITSLEYPTPAKRPKNSRLDCSRIVKQIGFRMSDWHESLSQVMQEYMASESI